MDVSQPAVEAVVPPGELGVFDTKQPKDGGVNVMHHRRVVAVERLVASLVALAAGHAPLDAARPEVSHQIISSRVDHRAAVLRRQKAGVPGVIDGS